VEHRAQPRVDRADPVECGPDRDPGVTSLAVLQPALALGIAGVLLAIGIVLLVLLWSRVRRGYRRLRAWRDRRQPKNTSASA
jgi:hypothetical protein